jgi:hypothetical protein
MNEPDRRYGNVENHERLVRVETRVDHIDETVGNLAEKQAAHEISNTSAFSELREGSLRLQIATENLVKAFTESREDIVKDVASIKERLNSLQTKVIIITSVGGLVWVLLGERVMTVLGLK